MAKQENLFIVFCTRVTTSVPHQISKFASNLPDLFTAVVSVLDACVRSFEGNTLSTDCVTASSVNRFKNKIDTYLWWADYTYI